MDAPLLGGTLAHAMCQPVIGMVSIMKWKQTLTAALGTLLLQVSGEVKAFECPVYFAEAQAAIEKADESIQRMQGGMPMVAFSHFRHARMSLVEAEYHHTKENGYHHARAIVRANEARGHAVAAYVLSRKGTDQ
jgi:hypothetical protein